MLLCEKITSSRFQHPDIASNSSSSLFEIFKKIRLDRPVKKEQLVRLLFDRFKIRRFEWRSRDKVRYEIQESVSFKALFQNTLTTVTERSIVT